MKAKNLLTVAIVAITAMAATKAFAVDDKVAEAIAAEIAQDSGKSTDFYVAYAHRLALTLNRLSPEALDEVLGEHAALVRNGGTTGGGDPDPGGGGDPDPGGGGDPDPAGGGDPDPADAPLLDLLNRVPPMDSSDLKSALIDASPLSAAVMIAAIDRQPEMDTSDVKAVLEVNPALDASVLSAAIHRATPMNSSDLKTILIDNVPLSSEILGLVIDGTAPLDGSDRDSVIEEHQSASP